MFWASLMMMMMMIYIYIPQYLISPATWNKDSTLHHHPCTKIEIDTSIFTMYSTILFAPYRTETNWLDGRTHTADVAVYVAAALQ